MAAPVPVATTADADTLTLRWTPAVRSGRVQVAATPDFAAPLADLPVSGDEVAIERLGVDADALVWRIAGDDGAWSPATRADAPTDAVPEPTTTAPLPGTRLVWPVDGAPVDAGMATFEWTSDVPGPVTMQVSEDRTFARPVVNVEAEGTQLQLPDLLAETGRATYWRIGTSEGWTPPARFRPTSDDRVATWEDARERAQRAAALAEARAADAATAVAPPVLTDTTSQGFTVAMIYAMIASFGFLLAVLWRLTV